MILISLDQYHSNRYNILPELPFISEKYQFKVSDTPVLGVAKFSTYSLMDALHKRNYKEGTPESCTSESC